MAASPWNARAISDGRLLMADRNDAALIVQLAQWATMMGLDEAILEIFGDDFDPPTASLGFAPGRRVLQFGETVATLTKNNLLDEDLLLDGLWVSGLWTPVRSRPGPSAKSTAWPS